MKDYPISVKVPLVFFSFEKVSIFLSMSHRSCFGALSVNSAPWRQIQYRFGVERKKSRSVGKRELNEPRARSSGWCASIVGGAELQHGIQHPIWPNAAQSAPDERVPANGTFGSIFQYTTANSVPGTATTTTPCSTKSEYFFMKNMILKVNAVFCNRTSSSMR